jgi:hypothetical protein
MDLRCLARNMSWAASSLRDNHTPADGPERVISAIDEFPST